MKIQVLCAAILMNCALYAGHVVISNQSDLPCMVFLPDQPGSNAVMIPSTEDSSPLTTKMGRSNLFLSSALLGTKAIQVTRSGIEVWDYNLNHPAIISRTQEQFSDLHIVIDPVGQISVYNGSLLVQEYEKTENAQKEFLKALNQNDFNQARYWITQGADINRVNEEGNTPLLHYVRQNPALCGDIMKFLINCGANVNAQSRSGYTALLYCIVLNSGWHKSIIGDIITLLLNKGADPTIRNNEGISARSFITNPPAGRLQLRDEDKQYLIQRFGRQLGIA